MELPEEVSLQMQFLHSVLLPWVSNPYPNRSKQILDPLHRVFNPFPSIPDPLPYQETPNPLQDLPNPLCPDGVTLELIYEPERDYHQAHAV